MLMLATTMLLLGFFSNLYLRSAILNFLQVNTLVRTNYLGKNIITGAGLTIYISLLTTALIASLFFSRYQIPYLFLFGCTLITMAGFIDDVWGDHTIKGLKGHFRSLVKGNLTTGGLKALAGICSAFLIGRHFSSDNLALAVNTILLSLLINTFNLLDLRPGRAIKVLFISILFMLFSFEFGEESIWLLVVLGALLAYSPLDLSGKVMLGDTGSNLLGFIVGYNIIALASLPTKIILLTLLALLHWYSERHSLTKLIARVGFLNFIDRLGRPEI